MGAKVKSLNEMPQGKRLRIRNKFLILSPNAIYQVHGNRIKLKRAWRRKP